MAIKPEEVDALISGINDKLGDNAASVSEELTQLRSGYTGVYTENTDLAKTNKELSDARATLIETNGKLFNQLKDAMPMTGQKQDPPAGSNDDEDPDPLKTMLEHAEEGVE